MEKIWRLAGRFSAVQPSRAAATDVRSALEGRANRIHSAPGNSEEPDVGDKTKPLTVDRLDELLRLTAITHGPAGRLDAAR